MTRLRDIHGPGFAHADYLHALAAGHETGWWDDRGIPAPWPDDFEETHSSWQRHEITDTQQNGEQPPF